MRVLHSMAGASVGGAETFFVDSVKAIHEIDDYAQYVVTRNNNDYKMNEIISRHIPLDVARYSRHFPWNTKSVLKKAIKNFKPDIVHNYMARAGEFSQSGPHVNLGWYGGYYNPSKFKLCTHHAGVTKDIADHIVRMGVPASNVHVLHIYAEFEKGKKIDRAQFNTPDDAPLLVSLSRLHTKKGLDILLEAMIKVPDAYLWIAGSGPLEQELKEQCTALKLDARVKFLGWRNDRENLLATADICVFPSRYEPFGAVVIEAWATETPLVVAKAQGPKAYVAHEENGLLVDIDAVDELAMSINRVIEDKTLRNELVTNGLKAYQKYFTRDVYKSSVDALYQQITK